MTNGFGNPRSLGISLAIGWFVLPIVMFVCAWIIQDELSASGVLVTVLLTAPFILGTLAYTWMAIRRSLLLPSYRKWPRFVLLVPLMGLSLWALWLNVSPRRITPEMVSDSPFDKYWYSAPQTAYGSPSPFLRFFDSDQPDGGYPQIGRVLLDVGSLLGNVTLWMFLVFLLVSFAFWFLPKTTEPSNT